jgi:outer membrane immunogenic protein
MRKFLFASSAIAALMIAAPASAADMPVKARPLPPPPVFSWTGFYVGAHLGGAWGTTESTLKSVSATECSERYVSYEVSGKNEVVCESDSLGGFLIPISQTQTNGFLGGVQGGYNWQIAPWAVIGVEAQFSWTDLKGTSPCVVVLACSTEHDWITTLAGRFGVTYDRLLLYVKGGVAWSKVNYSASLTLGPDTGPFGNFITSVSDTRVGAMFGTGIEYAFWGNWSAKIEYDYIRFKDKDYSFPLSFAEGPFSLNLNFDTTIKEHIHLVKAGINYRFDWGKYPVVARY